MPDSVAAPVCLRCDYRVNPLGIESPRPRLSWELSDDRRGARQTGYHVQVASSPERLSEDGSADLWDSGRVDSGESVQVAYGGAALGSRQRCWWRVRVWDASSEPTPWGAPAWWEMGLLEPGDWRARWIESELIGGPRSIPPVPAMRRAFSLDGPARSARLYIAALGLYEAWLNGQRVGRDELTPGWTDYRKRVQYQVYDVADLLRWGENAIGVLLGDGWYCGHVEWRDRQFYGDRPRLLAQLEVTGEDGQTTTVVTDAAWRWAPSPILEADLIMGECHDARLDLGPWTGPDYDDTAWRPASAFDGPTPTLSAMLGPPVRATERLTPVADPRRLGSGWQRPRWVFDMGQNMVGRVRLRVRGRRGVTVRLRHAEMLDDRGELYTDNLRTARATDHFTLAGDGVETFEPRFTFHGFRYVELAGDIDPPGRDAVTGVVLHCDMTRTGTFACSNDLVNQLQHNIVWGQRGNFLDVPTDCPQRDERLGWTGDAQVFIRTAAFNYDVASFFAKWQRDIADAQTEAGGIPPVCPNTSPGGNALADGGPGWADAAVICPWTVLHCYADRGLLERHYASMQRYLDFLDRHRCKDDVRSHPDVDPWGGFGDWLAMDHGFDSRDGATPKDLIGTAFHAHVLRLMARIAHALDRPDDADAYARRADRARDAFQRRFVTADGLIAGMTQTAAVLALHFDLLRPEHRAAAADFLAADIRRRGGHLSTGFLGAPYINHVLSTVGRDDLAFQLLLQTSWPSWLYPVTRGATTVWERWNGWTHDRGFADPGMNSFNHYAYGSIGSWLYQHVAGIDADPDHPGYRRLIIRPRPGGGLNWARAELRCVYGQIRSHWRRDADRFTLDLNLPPNTTARVSVPTDDPDSVTEGDAPLADSPDAREIAVEHDAVAFDLPAGRYRLACHLNVERHHHAPPRPTRSNFP